MNKIRIFFTKNDKKVDVINRVPEEDFIRNLTAIKSLARKKHFELIFLNQPTRQLTTHHYDPLIRSVCATGGALFLDLLPAFSSSGYPPGDLFLDSNHYSPLGNQIIANRIFTFLKEKMIVVEGK